jgi:hypothetical protein
LDLLELARNLVAVFGGIAAIVVMATAAIWGFVKLFGERWISSRFDQRLADYRRPLK